MEATAPMVTVKMRFPRNEPFTVVCKRIAEAVADARTDRITSVDKELALALALPGPDAARRDGDAARPRHVNLMPAR